MQQRLQESLHYAYYKDSINRSYYASFYAIKAVLALDEVDFKRHKDAVAYFNKTYVATSIFPRELGKKLGRLKQERETSDYDDFYIASLTDAMEQYAVAEFIITEIRQCLNTKNIPYITENSYQESFGKRDGNICEGDGSRAALPLVPL